MPRIQVFTDLLAWQEGHRLVISIYKLVKSFPKTEVFGLSAQMQRAAVSITSNIAEGFGRHTYKERTHFYYMAQGSLTELKNQLLIAKDIGYIVSDAFQDTMNQANKAHKLLQGLISKTLQYARS